jgi:CRP-like cAMP-binding protein
MDFLKLLRNWKDVEEHGAQTVIFQENNPADALFIIISGEVEITLHGEYLGTEGKGGIIGEMAVTPSATQNASATSITDVKLARVNREQLADLMSESTEFSLHVMATLANRLRAVNLFIRARLESA